MEEILEILSKDARISPEEIAKMTGQTVAKVKKTIAKLEKDGAIVHYKAVINPEIVQNTNKTVRAIIEVGVSPQKNVGFDAIAKRIYEFPEVQSCYLMSGAYDLLVIVEGEDIQTVSEFISSKLSPLEHVRSTATHFLLKKFKEDGQIFHKPENHRRLNISY